MNFVLTWRIPPRGNTKYAEYDLFAVTSGKQKYQLSLGTYAGKCLEMIFNWWARGDDYRVIRVLE